jgi:transcriptional regulator with PAS, ATPase and Fis domain
MSSILKKIQDTVIKYANVISHVINVDVEIVDKNLLRIAGTGIYKDKINEDITKEGMVYSNVLKTGEQHIIEEPGKHFLCEECESKNNCVEKMQICTPIRLDEEIIGVIGLVCSTFEQKDILIKNMDSYLPFLVQIADFIRSKVYEYIEKERNKGMINLLRQITDSLDRGVLVINNESEIVHMNQKAMRQLKLPQIYSNKHIEIDACNGNIAGEELFNIVVDKRKTEVTGNLIPVFPSLPPYDKIFIFSEVKRSKSEVSLTYEWSVIRADDIIGQSSLMVRVKEKIKRIADSKSTVLVTGESGTGKELIARAIHAEGDRWDKPFIAINCGAIPDSLLESELFGYVRGAFTGADSNGRVGKFELANGGVIFLDEIGDMPLYLQVKILRVLQEKKIVRIGSNQMIDLDIRVIAATNKNLKQMVDEGTFREDLYYRLNVIPIEIPPLRDRGGDIKLMILKMVERYKKMFDKKISVIDDETIDILCNYSWPGNVRELENAVEFMINMANETGVLNKETLPTGILKHKNNDLLKYKDLDHKSLVPLKEIEKEYILRAIDIFGNDVKGKKLAAKSLGIGIATLYRKLDEIKEDLVNLQQ